MFAARNAKCLGREKPNAKETSSTLGVCLETGECQQQTKR